MRDAAQSLWLAHHAAGVLGVVAVLVGWWWQVREQWWGRLAARWGIDYRRREWWV